MNLSDLYARAVGPVRERHEKLSGAVFLKSGKSVYAEVSMALNLPEAHDDRAKCVRLLDSYQRVAEAVENYFEHPIDAYDNPYSWELHNKMLETVTALRDELDERKAAGHDS